MRFLILKLIEIYQIVFSFDRGLLMFLAPGGACRYEITCSEFTKQSIIRHGIAKGIVYGVRRFLSCR